MGVYPRNSYKIDRSQVEVSWTRKLGIKYQLELIYVHTRKKQKEEAHVWRDSLKYTRIA